MLTVLKFVPPIEDVKHAFADSIDTKSYVKKYYNVLTSIINYSNFEDKHSKWTKKKYRDLLSAYK